MNMGKINLFIYIYIYNCKIINFKTFVFIGWNVNKGTFYSSLLGDKYSMYLGFSIAINYIYSFHLGV